MNLIEREHKRNGRIYVAGIIGLVFTICALIGVWWVMVLQYTMDPYFFTAVAVSSVIAYGIAWMLRGKTTNSIGLQIHLMTKQEAYVHLAMLIDHLKDEHATKIDYKVEQLEDKRK
jgi:hypothetical protein